MASNPEGYKKAFVAALDELKEKLELQKKIKFDYRNRTKNTFKAIFYPPTNDPSTSDASIDGKPSPPQADKGPSKTP